MAETEAVLLRRFTGSGDAEAFAEIIRRHAGVVYGAALRILADVDRASDVAQETFLQLTKDAGHVTGSLPGWLHRVATHKAIDERRRDASRRHRERDYVVKEPPRDAAEWKEISPYVDVGLRELDPEIRDVLILHFLEGRTTREIALARNTSQATISRRIGSGVEQLRAKLRRRGILVAVGALSALLGDNAVQAAPLPLLTELGKMALVGGAAGTASAGSGLHTIGTSVLTAVKTKVVAIAAVAVISAGSVVICYELTKSASEPAAVAPAGFAAASLAHDTTASPSEIQRRPAPSGSVPQVRTLSDQPTVAAQDLASTLDGETLEAQQAATDLSGGRAELALMAIRRYSGAMGGFGGMVYASTPPLEGQQKQQTGPMGNARPGDGSDANLPVDPNLHDPNDPGEPQPRSQ